MIVCVCSYIICRAVCPFGSDCGHDEAEVLLRAGQRLVVETIVHLLIAQGEGGRQRSQLGGNVGLGGVQVTPASQDRAFA